MIFILNISNVFGGSGVYAIDWPTTSEVLEYHSCGCADSCWVAELYNRKSRKLKIRLSCDCEKLYVTYKSNKSKKLLNNNCDEFNVDEINGKSKVISEKIQMLLHKNKN